MSDFVIDGDAIGPQNWMQWRRVNTASTPSAARTYDPTNGIKKNDPLQTLELAWTNDSDRDQWVYGWITTGGRRVTLQARSRGYIATSHGVLIDETNDPDNPPDVDVVEVSRFGVGTSLGMGGLLNTGGAYAISERRQNSRSSYLMPQVAGWFLVEPGKTIHARVEVRFKSTFWENTQIDGGDYDTESSIDSGDLTLDLFAVPRVEPVKPRLVPTVVGVSYDVSLDNGVTDVHSVVPVPAGVAQGDILLAIVTTNTGVFGIIAAEQSGWTLLHGRDAGTSDAHAKVYVRTATDDEPEHYTWANGLLAEETAIIIALRNADAYDPLYPIWYVASTIANRRSADVHTAPSIDAVGQLLISASFFSHPQPQGAIHQSPPDGMTEVVDVGATFTSMAAAVLASPPSPTGARVFAPATSPVTIVGHTINLTVLVPGVRDI